ncbi:MAG: hypothetical protein ACREMM_04015 [Gemmatimonadales bacterium]
MSRARASKHRLSRPDLAAEILIDLVKQRVEETRDARAAALARPRRARQPLYLLGLVGLFLGLTGWNVVRATDPPAVYSPQEWEASLRFRIYLAAQAVEAYRESTGALPTTLAALGIDDEGFSLVPGDSTYTIVAQHAPQRLSYRRGDDLAPFASAYAALARGGRP